MLKICVANTKVTSERSFRVRKSLYTQDTYIYVNRSWEFMQVQLVFFNGFVEELRVAS